MGQPKGVTVEEAQERNRAKSRVKDIASHACADAITQTLQYYATNPDGLQREYAITEVEAAAVLNEMRALRKRIDPYGDWS